MNKPVTVIFLSLAIISCASGEKDSSPLKDMFGKLNGTPVIPREANKIVIASFSNITSVQGMESRLSALLKKHISLDGRLAPVSQKENPDILLKGSIYSYSVQATAHAKNGAVIEKRIIIKSSIALYDLKKKNLIFHDPFIQSFRKFSDRIPPISTESACREYVLDNLALRIASKTVSGWYTKHLTPIEKGKKN